MNKLLTGLGILSLIVFLIPVPYDIWNLGNMTGTALSVFLCLYGIFFQRVNQRIKNLWAGKGRRFLKVLTGILLLFAVLAILLGGLMFGVAECEVQNATLVVLGCDVSHNRPGIMLQERLDRALLYLNSHPDTPIVCAGGLQEPGEPSESTAMRNYLLEHGIDEKRIYTDDTSTSTMENLRNAAELVNEYNLPSTLQVVSSDFHTYRITKMAEKAGLDVQVLKSDTVWFLLPTYYIRECAGIIYFELTGK